MSIAIKAVATSAIAILALSVFMGMFGVTVLGQQALLETVIWMFKVVIVAIIVITALINLPRILGALPL